MEPEDELQRVVDSSQLVMSEVGDLVTEIASVDRADHFTEHAGGVPVEADLRVKARGRGAGRGWADNDC